LDSEHGRGIGTNGLTDPAFQRKYGLPALSMKGRRRLSVTAQVPGINKERTLCEGARVARSPKKEEKR